MRIEGRMQLLMQKANDIERAAGALHSRDEAIVSIRGTVWRTRMELLRALSPAPPGMPGPGPGPVQMWGALTPEVQELIKRLCASWFPNMEMVMEEPDDPGAGHPPPPPACPTHFCNTQHVKEKTLLLFDVVNKTAFQECQWMIADHLRFLNVALDCIARLIDVVTSLATTAEAAENPGAPAASSAAAAPGRTSSPASETHAAADGRRT